MQYGISGNNKFDCSYLPIAMDVTRIYARSECSIDHVDSDCSQNSAGCYKKHTDVHTCSYAWKIKYNDVWFGHTLELDKRPGLKGEYIYGNI